MRMPPLMALIALLAGSAGPWWSARAGQGPGMLGGVVVDERGEDLSGVSVVVRLRGRLETTTNSLGDFVIDLGPENISDADRLAGVVEARLADGRIGVARVNQPAEKRERVRVVVKPARAVAVVAVDRRGRGVPGAIVEVTGFFRTIVEGRTDEAGRWSGSIASDETDVTVSARKGGVGFDYSAKLAPSDPGDQPAPFPGEIRLTPDGARTFRFRAVDREGRPIEGVEAFPHGIKKPGQVAPCWFGQEGRDSVTGADGNLAFDWLPGRFDPANLAIMVRSDRFYLPGFPAQLDPERPGDEVVVTMLPRERLSGRVTLADGTPASGAVVMAQGRNRTRILTQARAEADADGRYSMMVGSEAVYMIAAKGGDLASPFRWDATVRAGGPTEGVDLVLGPATRVRGRVVTAGRGRGASVVLVSLKAEKGPIPPELRRANDEAFPIAMNCYTRADAEGRYEIAVGPGDYTLAGPLGVVPVPVSIPAVDPPAEIVIDLQAAEPGKRPLAGIPGPEVIVGTVVDEAGRAVEGAAVEVRGAAGGSATTDAMGEFRIAARLEDLSPVNGRGGSVVARVADGRMGFAAPAFDEEKRERIRVVIKASKGLTVVAVDREGRGVPGAVVEVCIGSRPIAGGPTDEAGRWSGRVPSDPTTWAISARKGGVGFDYATNSGAIRAGLPLVAAPDEVTLRLDGASTVQVRAVDREGRPIRGINAYTMTIRRADRADVYFYFSGRDGHDRVTAEDGRIALDWLPENFDRRRLAVRLGSDRYYQPELLAKVDPDRPGEEVVVTMLPRERLSGRVTLADGSPVADALVRAQGRNGTGVPTQARARTDADGRYSMMAGSEAVFTIVARAEGLASPYRWDAAVRAGRPTDGVDLVLGPATKVRGRVVTEGQGKGVPDSVVILKAEKGPIPPELRREGGEAMPIGMNWITTTDEEGRYEIAVGPGEYTLGGPRGTTPVPVTIPSMNPPAEVVVDFRVAEPGAGARADGPVTTELAGFVVDEVGTTVDGASLEIRTGGRAEGKTDPLGWFHVPLPPDSFTQAGNVAGTILARAADGRVGLEVVGREAGLRDLIRVVVAPPRELKVRVVDREGRGVAGAIVELTSGSRVVLDGRTDGDGRWSVSAPAEVHDWSLSARKGGLGFDYAVARIGAGLPDPAIALPGAITLRLDGARTVRVKAVDSKGWPISGVAITPYHIERPDNLAPYSFARGLDRRFVTGADGTVALDWMPGNPGKAPLFFGESDRYYSPGPGVVADPDRPDGDLILAMLPRERLSGRVTLADGRPAARAVVRVQGRNWTPSETYEWAMADADGRYSMSVGSECAYVVAARLDDLASPCRWDVIVRAGQASDGVDLVLGRGTKIRGRVMIGEGDRPAIGVAVSLAVDKGPIPPELRREGDGPTPSIAMYWHARTDQDGRYEVGVGACEYWVHGPIGGDPVFVTVPGVDPPGAVVVDFRLPEPEPEGGPVDMARGIER